MKVRLMGTAGECRVVVDELRALATASAGGARRDRRLRVVSVSEPYPCRGESELVRVYVELRLGGGGVW